MDGAFRKKQWQMPSSFQIQNIVRSPRPFAPRPRYRQAMRSSKPSRRKIGHIFLLLLLGSVMAVPAWSQASKSPEQTVKDFYRWYLHELNAEREPRKERTKVNAIVSARLKRWFSSKAGREWDADYFI